MDKTSNIIHNTLGQPELSIIVPVYNVELYLRKCVDSLLNQDISNYEIILVDDGSTDACPQICDEYAAHHNTPDITHNTSDIIHNTCPIRVIHQANAGLSAARNTGIMAARGTYLMFVDSDDYIESNVLGALMAQVERDNLDVLRYKHQYVDALGKPYNPYKSNPYKGHDYSKEVTDGVTFLNTRFGTSCYAWQFILRRNLLITPYTLHLTQKDNISNIIHNTSEKDDCLFTPGIYFEDTDWTPRMLAKAKRVASTDRIVYNYLLTRQGSITNAVNRSKQKKVLDDKMHLISTLQQQALDLYRSGRNNVWYQYMIADTVVSIIGILSTTFYAEKDSYLSQLEDFKVFPIVKKSLKARLINLSPRLAVELLHLKNGK